MMSTKKYLLFAAGLIGLGIVTSDGRSQQGTKTRSAAIPVDPLVADGAPTSENRVRPADSRLFDVETNSFREVNTSDDFGVGPTADRPTGVRLNGQVYKVGVTGSGTQPPSVASGMRPKVVSQTFKSIVYEAIPAEELEEQQRMRELIPLLNSSDESEKKKAAEMLHTQLVKQFDRDVVNREKELVTVEERLRLLRQQLEKRKAARDEIVGLRLKTIVHNAEGLGFPGDGVFSGADVSPPGAVLTFESTEPVLPKRSPPEDIRRRPAVPTTRNDTESDER